jgi:predicted NAD/FAD-binding protein
MLAVIGFGILDQEAGSIVAYYFLHGHPLGNPQDFHAPEHWKISQKLAAITGMQVAKVPRANLGSGFHKDPILSIRQQRLGVAPVHRGKRWKLCQPEE